MGKDMEKVVEVMEKEVDTVMNTFVNRVVDRVDQIEPMVEKGKETVGKMAEIATEGFGTVIDAVADHISGIVNKEISLETEKERAKNTVETLVEKAGEYIEVVAESVSRNIAMTEENIEKDIDATKKLNEELKENIHNLKGN